MNSKTHIMPRLLSWLLDKTISAQDWIHLKGDYEEIYHETACHSGRIAADSWILKQLASSALSNIKDALIWRNVMIFNYLKVAVRNMSRYKGYSVINILGLAIGMACTILIMQWVQDEISYDRFHEHANQLYVPIFSNGSMVTPPALASYLKSEYPEVMKASIYHWLGEIKIKYGEDILFEKGSVAEPDFLEMFTIPFLQGDPATALNDPKSIIISRDVAQKLFGSSNAVGHTVHAAGRFDLKITGVFENYPENSHTSFDYIVPVALSREWGWELDTWERNFIRTYVMLHENTDVQAMNEKIKDVVSSHRPREMRKLTLKPMTRIHLYRHQGGGRITYVILFSILAIFILLIACINFMNLTTARSATRSREVGMRKTVGAERRDLIRQFFSESIVLTLISLFIGLGLTLLFLPLFNQLTGKQYTAVVISSPNVILGIAVIALLTGLISGSYPALYLSRFQPLNVLKGSVRSGKGAAAFRRILVIVQYALSIFLILGSVIVHGQLDYMRSKNVGFDKENIVMLSIGGEFRKEADAIRQRMLESPDIADMTLTSVAPYRWNANAGYGDVDWEGKTNQQVKMVMTSVDYDFVNTFGLKIKQGRFLSRDFSTDKKDAYVINEAAVKAMEMEDPVGKELEVWGDRRQIIGVLEDYHFESLHHEIIPLALQFQPDWYTEACIKINGSIPGALKHIETIWKEVYPEDPFNYRFLDETIARQYREEEQIGQIFQAFTLLAIFISCLGLFGLASFTAEQRTKEIGIRKVMGAKISELILLLTKEFAKWVLLANCIAWPAAWFLMKNFLTNFAYQYPVGIGIFLFSGGTALAVAMLTVSLQVVKAARTNPAESLKYE